MNQVPIRKEQSGVPPGKRQRADETPPAAGPHDKPELTDETKTPGAGTLPTPGTNEESTSG